MVVLKNLRSFLFFFSKSAFRKCNLLIDGKCQIFSVTGFFGGSKQFGPIRHQFHLDPDTIHDDDLNKVL